ncbi:hypothetical protein QBC47DRAFT_116521 [Echria macrotheca]|uniref:C2H2-type domain-containing protein n=1 Tax=Echria macrotheca TaxID=438768 RepID=A0AAJ0BK94_9PEZI|nr:hypothetical protein QBC47DRAFT_116521 [Echria macrotheca]
MSNQKELHGNRRRVRWDCPEESCGGLITKLPGPGGRSVWMAVGRAAEVWQNELSFPILELVKETTFGAGLSLFMYMVGKDQSTASPRIIFCSQDIQARKAIRKTVENSGILHKYPAIGLGDASSPLARHDSGLGRRGSDSAAPESSHHTDQISSNEASQPLESQGPFLFNESRGPLAAATIGTELHIQQGLNVLIPRLEEMRISQQHPVSFSCDDSGYRTLTGSPRPNSSGTPTPTSSMPDLDLLGFGHQPPFTPQTFKDDNCNASFVVDPESGESDSGDDFEFRSDIDDDDDEEDDGPSLQNPSIDPSPLTPRDLSSIFDKVVTAFEGQSRGGAGNNSQPSQAAQPLGSIPAESSARAPLGTGSSNTPMSLEKRPLTGGSNPEDTSTARSKRRKQQKAMDRGFACVYWKKDTRAYVHCSRFKFDKVSRMKQHLCRNHAKKIRCPRCQREFLDSAARDGHIRDEDCVRRPVVFDEGIDENQAEQLKPKGRAVSQEERWFAAWDIVFPGLQRPVSPFNDDDGPSLAQFQEFVRRDGPGIIMTHMRQTPGWGHDDGERLSRGPWNAIFDDIERLWLSRRTHGDAQVSTVTASTETMPEEEPLTDLALDPSPSPPGNGPGDAFAAQIAYGTNSFRHLDQGVGQMMDQEIATLDGEQYDLFSDRDLNADFQWTYIPGR